MGSEMCIRDRNQTVFNDETAGDVLVGGDDLDFFFAHKVEGEADRVYRFEGERLDRI